MNKLQDLKIKDEDIIQLNEEWILCHQAQWILFFHIHEDGAYYCINHKCSSCDADLPGKIATIGKFRTI